MWSLLVKRIIYREAGWLERQRNPLQGSPAIPAVPENAGAVPVPQRAGGTARPLRPSGKERGEGFPPPARAVLRGGENDGHPGIFAGPAEDLFGPDTIDIGAFTAPDRVIIYDGKPAHGVEIWKRGLIQLPGQPPREKTENDTFCMHPHYTDNR